MEYVKIENGFCVICSITGPPMQSTHDMWTIGSLHPITTTCPTLLIILASWSSPGARIPPGLFRKLQETILEQCKEVFLILIKKKLCN
jgi:hypothetical protein